jgi:hypothetical protein
MTAGAHSAAGGGLPNGGALVMSLLACATVGTLLGCIRVDGRGAGWAATSTALCAAQLLGHTALVTAGHHHGGPALDLNASMTATHIGAAVILGLAITASEYLYLVCSSVLCWLRLFTMRAPRHAARVVRRTPNIVVTQPVLTTGLGMRAPPRMAATA